VTRRSLNPLERMTYSAARRSSKHAMRTDFVLRGDQTNKHRVHSVVHKTMTVQNSIPFLRDPRNVSNQKFEAVVITDEK